MCVCPCECLFLLPVPVFHLMPELIMQTFWQGVCWRVYLCRSVCLCALCVVLQVQGCAFMLVLITTHNKPCVVFTHRSSPTLLRAVASHCLKMTVALGVCIQRRARRKCQTKSRCVSCLVCFVCESCMVCAHRIICVCMFVCTITHRNAHKN